MASPAVSATNESSTNTAGTSHTVTLPAGASQSNPTFISSANTRDATISYLITGVEDPATQAPEKGTTATGTSTAPDPPAAVMTGGSKDYLVIALYGAAGEEADDDTWSDTSPTNYTPTPPLQKSCGTAGSNLGGLIAASSRQLTASAENPGVYAKDVSAAWRAQTVTIHPGLGTLTLVLMNIGSTLATINALAGWTELLDEGVAGGLFIAYAWVAPASKIAKPRVITQQAVQRASYW